MVRLKFPIPCPRREGCYAGNPREGQIAWARERASGYISARKTKLMVGGRMDFGQLDLEMSGEEVSKPYLSAIHRWHNVQAFIQHNSMTLKEF